MLTETVSVTAVNTDTLTIKLNKHSACGCCKTPFMCSNTGSRELTIENNKNINITPGDTLEVGMEERFTIIAAFLAFGIPSVILLTALYIFKESGPLISFLIAILLIFVYYLAMRKLLKNNVCFKIIIIKKI
jgi:positive regulator of sigma E activity